MFIAYLCSIQYPSLYCMIAKHLISIHSRLSFLSTQKSNRNASQQTLRAAIYNLHEQSTLNHTHALHTICVAPCCWGRKMLQLHVQGRSTENRHMPYHMDAGAAACYWGRHRLHIACDVCLLFCHGKGLAELGEGAQQICQLRAQLIGESGTVLEPHMFFCTPHY